jgi:DNA-binding transcriptional LysR family regulator
MKLGPLDLRLDDVETFLVVERLGSVTASARQLGVTPSQVCKALARLEQHLGAMLLTRSNRGVALTEVARRLLPRLEELVVRARSLQRNDASTPLLTVVAQSYMNACLLPAIASALPGTRIRGLEMPLSLVRTFASSNFFDATVILGTPRLPAAWALTELGFCRKAVFASPALARQLGTQPIRVEKLLEIPFINPVFNVNGQFAPMDDECPLPVGARRAGHEAQTIAIALELAASTEQLAFGPAFAAIGPIVRGALVEVSVRGWNLRDPVYLGCNVDRVLAPVQAALVRSLRAAVGELEQRSSRAAFTAVARHDASTRFVPLADVVQP